MVIKWVACVHMINTGSPTTGVTIPKQDGHTLRPKREGVNRPVRRRRPAFYSDCTVPSENMEKG